MKEPIMYALITKLISSLMPKLLEKGFSPEQVAEIIDAIADSYVEVKNTI